MEVSVKHRAWQSSAMQLHRRKRFYCEAHGDINVFTSHIDCDTTRDFDLSSGCTDRVCQWRGLDGRPGEQDESADLVAAMLIECDDELLTFACLIMDGDSVSAASKTLGWTQYQRRRALLRLADIGRRHGFDATYYSAPERCRARKSKYNP